MDDWLHQIKVKVEPFLLFYVRSDMLFKFTILKKLTINSFFFWLFDFNFNLIWFELFGLLSSPPRLEQRVCFAHSFSYRKRKRQFKLNLNINSISDYDYPIYKTKLTCFFKKRNSKINHKNKNKNKNKTVISWLFQFFKIKI